MRTNGNDPANPIKDVGFDAEKGNISFDVNLYDFKVNLAGLTKREYFAAMALQGMLSNNHGFTTDTGITSTGIDQKARFCTLMADALIEALNK